MVVLPRAAAFGAVGCATAMVSVVVGIPAPLNPLYETRYGVPPSVLTGAFAIYVVCAAASMLTCGRLSDHVGRRAVSVVALAFSGTSCLMFLVVDGSATFVAGRVLQGIGVGLGMSALGAYVVDLAPPRLVWLASLTTSVAAPLGTASGALASGALVEYAPRPMTLVFWLAAAAVVVCIVGVLLSPETVPSRPGARRSLVPRVAVPGRLRVVFLGGCLCFVACWALGGFYQSLGASIAHDVLLLDGALFGGAVAGAVIGTTVVGGVATSHLPARRALVLGVLAFVTGVIAIAITLRIGSPVAFIAASMLAGVGFGAAFNACMRGLLEATRPEETAGVLAAVYLIGFLGSALPNSVAGFAVQRWGLIPVVETYCLLTGVLVVAAGIVVIPRLEPRSAEVLST